MKTLSLFVFFFSFTCFSIFAQTAPINPSSATIGGLSTSRPSGWSADYLSIFKNGTTIPTMRIGNTSGNLSLAVANNAGEYEAFAANDVIFRLNGSNRMIFSLNTVNEFNTRKLHFGNASTGFKTLVVSNGDKVGMGTETFPTNDPNFRLYVKGGIKAQEVKVELCNGWCDYVFYPNYNLAPLSEVKTFIETNKHLPNIPSAATLEKEEGFELGKMTTLQQEKIEELFLYVIQLDEKIKKLEKENEELKTYIQNK